MRTLTIIRHAKSSWDDLSMADFDRPLNARGQADAPRIGQELRNRAFSIDQLILSPAKRAQQTAELICHEIGYSLINAKEEPNIYEATLADLQTLIEAQDDSVKHLTLIGHNPSFESLCNYTQDNSVSRLTTCNVVQYQLNCEHWSQFDYHCGTLAFHLQPKALQNS